MATYRRLTYKPDPYQVNTCCLVCGESISEGSTVWLWMSEAGAQLKETTNPTPALPPSVNPIVYSHFTCGEKAGLSLEKPD